MTSTIDPSETKNEEGLPEEVIDPTYPHEYYHDLGQNPNELDSNVNKHKLSLNRQDKKNPNGRLAIPIRRHAPGSTDPIHYETKSRSPSPAPSILVTPRKLSSRPSTYTVPVQNKPSKPSTKIDPDERPIKPMKDTSLYSLPTSERKTTSRKTPLKLPKIKQTPTPFQSDSFRATPARKQNQSVIPRRPIFADIFIKTPRSVPARRIRSQPVVVEDYIDDDYYSADDSDDIYEVYEEHIPKKVVSYQEVTGMTTRERENYLMNGNQRAFRPQQGLVRRIIYPN